MALNQAMLDEIRAYCKDTTSFERICQLVESQVAKFDEVEATLQHTIDVLQGEARERLKLEETLAVQEHLYRTMFENVNIGLAFKKGDRVERANRVYLDMLGYTLEELAEKSLADFTHPDDLPRQLSLNAQLERGDIRHYTLAKRYVRKDGTTVWAETSASAFRDKTGDLLSLIAVRDLTQEIKVQEKIRQSEAQLAWLLNALPFAVAIYKNKVPIFGNRAFYDSRGLRDMAHWLEAKSQEMASDDYALIHPDDYNAFISNLDDYRRRVDSGELLKTERRIRRYGEAQYLWYECSIFKGNYIDGEKVVVEADVPIEARKQMMLELKESQHFLQSIYYGTSTPIFVIDVKPNRVFRVAGLNPAYFESINIPSEKVFGKTLQEIEHILSRELVEHLQKKYEQCVETGQEMSYEETFVLNGETSHYFTRLNPLKDASGRIYRIIGSTLDITERKEGELALRRSEAMLSETERLAHIGSWAVNFETGILTWSDEVFRIYERDISLGTPSYSDIFEFSLDAPTMKSMVQESIDNRRKFSISKQIALENGRVKWVEVTGMPIQDEQGALCGYSGYIRDITYEKQIEAERELLYHQLLQSQKMESIGVLASGVAHEFNNILMGILGSVMLLKKEVAGNPKSEKRVAQIEAASGRAATIVKQMLGFARQGKMSVQAIDLRQCITDILDVFTPTLDKRIRVTTNFQVDEATCAVQGDNEQLEQVILNLAVNARDALMDNLSEIPCPKISFTLTAEMLPKSLIAEAGLPSDMRALHLAVRDNGIGIPKEIQSKIFEPFFTKKEVGKGTGLGLSMVYGIVKNHQGFIWVESTVGEGTTFHLYFPLSDKSPSKFYDKSNTDEMGSVKGTILVVDDEQLIREFLTELLEDHGYLVYSQTNGKEGLAFFEAHQSEIDLAVVNKNMPEVDGVQLLSQLKSLRPNLPMILITGYMENEDLSALEEKGRYKVFTKPFEPHEFLSAVASALQ